jgi:hypothetical protein
MRRLSISNSNIITVNEGEKASSNVHGLGKKL